MDKNNPVLPEEIDELLSDGYIVVMENMWSRIPKGAHIRYMKKTHTTEDNVKKNNNTNTYSQNLSENFCRGGYVKNHVIVGEKSIIYLGTSLSGRRGDPGYVEFPVDLQTVSTIWKKYDYSAFIELHMIINILASKSVADDERDKRLTALEENLQFLENMCENLMVRCDKIEKKLIQNVKK